MADVTQWNNKDRPARAGLYKIHKWGLYNTDMWCWYDGEHWGCGTLNKSEAPKLTFEKCPSAVQNKVWRGLVNEDTTIIL